jgi:hypothetical protein
MLRGPAKLRAGNVRFGDRASGLAAASRDAFTNNTLTASFRAVNGLALNV